MALYRFDERWGRVTHSEITGGPDLDIPTPFQIPYHAFLRAPWTELGGADWKDVAINVVGFIPFGFCFLSFLLSTRRSRRAALTTMIVGALVSLAFEVLQWYIPSRHSSVTDLITNVTGTGLGVMLHRLTMPARGDLSIVLSNGD